jgi:hypothetical protein
LAACALVVVQVGLIVHAEWHANLFGGKPLSWVDFDTHAEQTWRAIEAMEGWGQTWAYDPQLLAGYPNGAVFEADNKGWELWTYALVKAGVPKATAFNLFLILAHLLVVPVVYAAARLFELSRWEALLAAWLALMIWFFDGLCRWSWFSGALAFGIATVWFVLPLGLFYRFVVGGSQWLLVLLAPTMAIGHLIHPSLFVFLVVPMVALYVRSFRSLSRRDHVGVVAVALFVIGANAYWLFTAFRFAHYVIDHEPFFVGGLSYLVTDLLGLIQDMGTSGVIGNRTGFRFVALLGCAAVLLAWRRAGDDRRTLPLGLGVGVLVGLAYLGGYLGPLAQIQPYRSIVPAAFLACIGAAAFVGFIRRSGVLRGLPRVAWCAIGLVGLLGSVHLVRDALYFFPTALPTVPKLPSGETLRITAMGFLGHQDYRHKPATKDLDELVRWVEDHDDGQGRFLVEWWWLGEHLAWRTEAQILGGFRQRNLEHTAANLFRAYPDGDLPDDELARYLETYAVRWVILSLPKPELEQRSTWLRLVAKVGFHRIYETNTPVSLLQQGSGGVLASLNRLDVTGSDPDADVVLRFHWLETLDCLPGCRVAREPVEGNPVGFVRVPAPHPTDFAVVNGY